MSDPKKTKTIKLTIDGQAAEFDEGTTLLEAARIMGIDIPTLCYHEALSPLGACRLCQVEITRRGRSRLVVSCMYPVQEGLEVATDSHAVHDARRGIVEFLLAQAPNCEAIKELARRFSVDKPRFVLAAEDQSDCILCGLCARVCAEIVGAGAIDFIHRGVGCTVGPPFYRASDVCIGCGTCVYICPTGHIKVEDINQTADMHDWSVEADSRQCRVCGGYHLAPELLEDYSEFVDGQG